jgi:hypothetical protein
MFGKAIFNGDCRFASGYTHDIQPCHQSLILAVKQRQSGKHHYCGQAHPFHFFRKTMCFGAYDCAILKKILQIFLFFKILKFILK